MLKKTLTQRVNELEAELAAVKQQLPGIEKNGSQLSFADSLWGVFRDDPAFDVTMRLGREYRESLRN